jgi:hypothetical protein
VSDPQSGLSAFVLVRLTGYRQECTPEGRPALRHPRLAGSVIDLGGVSPNSSLMPRVRRNEAESDHRSANAYRSGIEEPLSGVRRHCTGGGVEPPGAGVPVQYASSAAITR